MYGPQGAHSGSPNVSDVEGLESQDSSPLPLPLTSMVGREHEIEEIAGLLYSGRARLLTLTGPGGVGKTRLALHVAARSHGSFADGAYFVPLAPVSSPDLVLSTVAQTLGVPEVSGRPLFNSLCAALQSKHLLLVLDNFEQVVVAAPQIVELLACAPRLQVLVTSRALLQVYGEHEYPVAALPFPDAAQQSSFEQLTQYEAVRLFIERARAAKPTFVANNGNAPALAEMCYRLDGLPLAIELAAARIKLMSPHALLRRLDRRLDLLSSGATNLPRRHQTLRNAIAWSYDLLEGDEKALFCSLSVFAGGCTVEAAMAVSGASQTAAVDDSVSATSSAHLDKLAALASKSLLRHDEQLDGEPRFFMLQTIREYALEELAASGKEREVRERHARFFVALAERADPELMGPDQALWLEKLAQDHDNMRAALLWAQRAEDAETGLRIGAAFWRFWYVRGYVTEGRKWLNEALEHGARADASWQIKALNCLGNLSGSQSDYEAARRYHSQSFALAKESGDERSMAVALTNLANTARLQGDYARSAAVCEQCLAHFKESGDEGEVATVLHILSMVTWEQGDREKGQRICEDVLTIRRKLGDKQSIATSLNSLGLIAASAGDYAAARACYEECLTLWRELGDKAGEARSLQALGEVLAEEGDHQTARTFQSASLRARYELGIKRAVAECLQGLAVVRGEHSEPRRLVRLIAAADALYAQIGAVQSPRGRNRYEEWLNSARARLGPDAFATVWGEGTMLPLEEAVALALEDEPSGGLAAMGVIAAPVTSASTRATSTRLTSGPANDLTPREIEVLRLLAAGLTNPGIAAHLHLSINTVQSHVRSIFSKINVNTRGAAVRYAFEHNLR